MLKARLLLALLVGLLACTSAPPPAPSAPPPPTLYTLTGLVSSAAGGPIPGAVIIVRDGSNIGRAALTLGDGRYVLPDLHFAGFSVSVSQPDYVTVVRGIQLDERITTATENFTLLPEQLWWQDGIGNAVVEVPAYVTSVRIVAHWNRLVGTPGFVVHIDGRLVVNQTLTVQRPNYDAVHPINGGKRVEITASAGINWVIQEVR